MSSIRAITGCCFRNPRENAGGGGHGLREVLSTTPWKFREALYSWSKLASHHHLKR